jgi:hypothetical protein
MQNFVEYLKEAHNPRLYTKAALDENQSLEDKLRSLDLMKGPSAFAVHPIHFLPVVGSISYFAFKHIVKPGDIGISLQNGSLAYSYICCKYV